jgi:hypothetical protein
VPCKSRALQMLGALNSRHSCQQCDHMSDLPQHSMCTDGRKHADGLAGACSSGWNIPASAGQLAYRKRVAKLILGYRDIAAGRSWAALAQLVPWAKGRAHEIGRRPVRICEIEGTWGDVSIAPS